VGTEGGPWWGPKEVPGGAENRKTGCGVWELRPCRPRLQPREGQGLTAAQQQSGGHSGPQSQSLPQQDASAASITTNRSPSSMFCTLLTSFRLFLDQAAEVALAGHIGRRATLAAVVDVLLERRQLVAQGCQLRQAGLHFGPLA